MLAEKNIAEESETKTKISHVAFSLIEVLVAMAVMVVIIVMVTNMFRDASEAWDTGTQRADMNTSARAAIEYMARELSCAVAGSAPDSTGGVAVVKRFTLNNENVAGVMFATNLSFTALSGEEGKPALRGIRLRYQNNIIETCRFTDPSVSYGSYESSDWANWIGVKIIITNVWRFEVTVCSNESDMMNGRVGYAYDSSANTNLLPACVDISIEMLGERDMARAMSLGAAADGFVMTNSRVYTTRVCFPNRGGK